MQSNEVPKYLLAADYGLLIRENTVTNQVASPVKFAEYLACGLPVIISRNLGDYSEFVTKNNCGYLLNEFNFQPRNKPIIKNIALNHFKKLVFIDEYRRLIII